MGRGQPPHLPMFSGVSSVRLRNSSTLPCSLALSSTTSHLRGSYSALRLARLLQTGKPTTKIRPGKSSFRWSNVGEQGTNLQTLVMSEGPMGCRARRLGRTFINYYSISELYDLLPFKQRESTSGAIRHDTTPKAVACRKKRRP